jgi:cytidine deaminase
MKKVEIVCHLTEYETIEELNAEDKLLATEAKASTGDAYAPYSHFQVGAALLLENGTIIKGNNQENASYPVGLCAERVAIYAAGANYPGVTIKALAISARSDLFSVNKPIPPCGACRQAIIEYEHRYGKNIRIIMVGESGKVITSESIGNLLPFQFDASDLKRRRK